MIQASEFNARRQRLFDTLQDRSAVLLFGGSPKVASADEDLPFEINRNFYYLTGIDQAESALLLLKADGERKEFLFILPFDRNKERWYGKRLTPEEAGEKSGIRNVLLTPTLSSKLDMVLNPDIREYGEIETLFLDLDREIKIAPNESTKTFKEKAQLKYPTIHIMDIYPAITKLRLKKSVHEIAEFRGAVASTKIGLMAVWNKLKPGVREYELANEFLRAINDDNCYQGLSFPTIMASGIHGTCLHYPTPLDTVKDGDLVLMDLGARFNYYCADVTRTLPADGVFSKEQRIAYDIVLRCNQMVESKAKPGVTIKELDRLTNEFLAKECVKAGFLKDESAINEYFFHGVSHLIGLDTHDPYLAPLDRSYKELPLEPGMIISNEPGLYMEDRGIGIRIEDDLLITENGCECLTRDIIKDPDQIEKFLASRGKK